METHGRGRRDSKSSSSVNCCKVKEPWSYNQVGRVEPYSCGLTKGFPWPPRSYTCMFCKRDFRSAQALGGHMNVHRRDRARLRAQSPLWDPAVLSNPIAPHCGKHIPNLNASPPSENSDAQLTPVACTFPSLFSPLTHFSSSSSSTSRGEDLVTVKALFAVGESTDLIEEDTSDVSKEREVLKLDLKIGLGSGMVEDLDLELRLGCT